MKNILIAVLATVCIGLFLGFYNNKTSVLGGMTNYDGLTIVPVDSTDGLKVGSSGSTIAKIIKGSCNLTGGTITASTTGNGECAVTGVVSGDTVFAQLASSSKAGIAVQAIASTTANGYIRVTIYNAAGVSGTVSEFGSSTSYLIVR